MPTVMLVIGVVCAVAGIDGTYHNESVQEHWLSVCILLYGMILILCSYYMRKLKR
jgi:hypothetical protein